MPPMHALRQSWAERRASEPLPLRFGAGLVSGLLLVPHAQESVANPTKSQQKNKDHPGPVFSVQSAGRFCRHPNLHLQQVIGVPAVGDRLLGCTTQ